MDPMLAATLTQFLAPALPALIAGGKKLVEAGGKELGEKGGEWVKSLWGKLRAKVEAQPTAIAAAAEVAKTPDDPDARAALRFQLRKILEAEPDLAAELEQLLAARPQPFYRAEVHGGGAVALGNHNGVAGAGGVGVGGSVHGNVSVGGRDRRDE